MNIETSLRDVDPNVAASIFDQKYAATLTERLQNKCILDPEGIARVMPVLKLSFCHGFKEVVALFKASENDPRSLEMKDPTSTLRHETQIIANAMADTLVKTLESMLYAMADQLAAYDERSVRRRIH